MSDRLDNIEKAIEQLANQQADAGRDVSGVHFGEQPVVSFYEDDPAPSMAKAKPGRPFYRNARITMPKNYQANELGTLGNFLRKGMNAPAEFKASHAKAIASLAKALNVETSEFSDGGALVLPEYAPEILRMVYSSDGLWQRSRQYTVAGNSMSFPRLRDSDRSNGQRHGGVLGYWTGEGDAITETKVQFDSTDLKLQKLAVAVFVTEEMLSDSGYAIEQFVTEVAQDEIDYQLDKALIRADGVGKPQGILNSDCLVTVAKESAQDADTIVSDNILKMWARRLSKSAGDDLVWMINQDIEPQLHRMFQSTGSNSGELSYSPPGALSATPYATLMGKPVIPTEHCSTLGVKGDIILGNLRHYLSINKGQINQIASPHVEFLRDLLCIKFTFRVMGRPAYDTPVTPEQSAATLSPFVALADRA